MFQYDLLVLSHPTDVPADVTLHLTHLLMLNTEDDSVSVFSPQLPDENKGREKRYTKKIRKQKKEEGHKKQGTSLSTIPSSASITSPIISPSSSSSSSSSAVPSSSIPIPSSDQLHTVCEQAILILTQNLFTHQPTMRIIEALLTAHRPITLIHYDGAQWSMGLIDDRSPMMMIDSEGEGELIISTNSRPKMHDFPPSELIPNSISKAFNVKAVDHRREYFNGFFEKLIIRIEGHCDEIDEREEIKEGDINNQTLVSAAEVNASLVSNTSLIRTVTAADRSISSRGSTHSTCTLISPPFTYDYFLSHKRFDTQDYCRALRESLRQLGHSVFLDAEEDGNLSGLLDNVKSSRVLVYVLSIGILDSDWCFKDLKVLALNVVSNYCPPAPRLVGIELNPGPNPDEIPSPQLDSSASSSSNPPLAIDPNSRPSDPIPSFSTLNMDDANLPLISASYFQLFDKNENPLIAHTGCLHPYIVNGIDVIYYVRH